MTYTSDFKNSEVCEIHPIFPDTFSFLLYQNNSAYNDKTIHIQSWFCNFGAYWPDFGAQQPCSWLWCPSQGPPPASVSHFPRGDLRLFRCLPSTEIRFGMTTNGSLKNCLILNLKRCVQGRIFSSWKKWLFFFFPVWSAIELRDQWKKFFVQNWIWSNLRSMSTSFSREAGLLILNQQEGLIEQVIFLLNFNQNL